MRTSADLVAQHFALFELGPFTPRFNIAPSQPIAAVKLCAASPKPQRELVRLRWGLIPGWAKDPAIGNRLINARAETAAEKPSFRTALRRRRCLVAADGFYEWQRTGSRKQPFFIHMKDDGPFAIAGVWETWEGPDHAAIESCALLTTEPNDLMRPIHNRMPVILEPESYDQWLDQSEQRPDVLAPLLRPFSDGRMQAAPVGTYVNNPAHEGPQCIEPEPDLFS